MAEKDPLYFYKSTVAYTVGVRRYIGDVIGRALTPNNPYMVVKEDDLRDFKRANREAIKSGLIMETKEPDWDDPTPNALEDEKATEIVKNVFALKKALSEFTSTVPVRKLLEAAEEQKRPEKTINIIKARLEELGEVEETPEQMRGVE